MQRCNKFIPHHRGLNGKLANRRPLYLGTDILLLRGLKFRVLGEQGIIEYKCSVGMRQRRGLAVPNRLPTGAAGAYER